MKLIDADKLKEVFDNTKYDFLRNGYIADGGYRLDTVKRIIDSQPVYEADPLNITKEGKITGLVFVTKGE